MKEDVKTTRTTKTYFTCEYCGKSFSGRSGRENCRDHEDMCMMNPKEIKRYEDLKGMEGRVNVKIHNTDDRCDIYVTKLREVRYIKNDSSKIYTGFDHSVLSEVRCLLYDEFDVWIEANEVRVRRNDYVFTADTTWKKSYNDNRLLSSMIFSEDDHSDIINRTKKLVSDILDCSNLLPGEVEENRMRRSLIHEYETDLVERMNKE